MKVTKSEIATTIHGYQCTIPKGTPVSHQTACGYDENYNFITREREWGPRLPDGSLCVWWLHDMKYRGYHIDNSLLEERNA